MVFVTIVWLTVVVNQWCGTGANCVRLAALHTVPSAAASLYVHWMCCQWPYRGCYGFEHPLRNGISLSVKHHQPISAGHLVITPLSQRPLKRVSAWLPYLSISCHRDMSSVTYGPLSALGTWSIRDSAVRQPISHSSPTHARPPPVSW